ncbi:hypothetical protein H9654_08785 [Stenotrophomonas sp. Sa5BUN4]|uniref:Uncharacterized protein n=1 Tax=Stenotrophomonas lacuserhaii TaxID=2760084 RepID=A0A8X8FQW2_9GAMM|nr:hypothetical protein [Stenotrophomonas pennii]MBD7954301.1 hypothetical protein [Stenotrophomonas pennii]
MNDLSADIIHRLERCELELQASCGCLKALEYGLRAVIAAHPDPATLASLWSQVLPEVADQHSGNANSTPLYDAAFQHALATLTEQIEATTDRDEKDD